jgi:hypothetical protein
MKTSVVQTSALVLPELLPETDSLAERSTLAPRPLPEIRRRRSIGWLVFIITSAVLINVMSVRDGHNWGGDFSQYLNQTVSLSKRNFEELRMQYTFIENNSSRQIAPILYPWGLPLLLNPVYQIWGLDVVKMKLVVYGFYAFSLLLIYALFCRRLPTPHALLLVAWFAYNPYFFSFRDNIVSDLPHFFFLLASLCVADRTLLRHRPLVGPVFDGMLLGTLLYVACLIRVSGFLLVLTLPVYQIASARTVMGKNPFPSRRGVFLVPYVVFGLLMLLTNWVLPNGSGNYVAVARRVVNNPMMLLDNLMYYVQLPSEFFYTKPFIEHITEYVPLPFDLFYNFTYTISLAQILFGVLLPFAAKGAWLRFRHDYPHLLYSGLLVASLIFYEKGGLRFLFPILPFFVYYALVGLRHTRLKIRNARISLVMVFGVVVMIDFLFQSLLLAYQYRKEPTIADGPYSASSRALFAYIARHTRPTDVFIFRKPTVLLFYANRLGFMVNSLAELPTAQRKATHLIIDRKNLKDQVAPDSLRTGAFAKRLTPVFENMQFVLYQIEKGT